jgi:hypothetical protein
VAEWFVNPLYTGKIKIHAKELIVRNIECKDLSKLFVEIVDSSQVSLYRYNYSYPGSTVGSTIDLVTFMLNDAATNSITTLPVSAYTGKGQRFRETMAPFVAASPDLLQLLEDGRITINNLPLLVHALNYAEPFPIKFKAKKVKEKVVEDPFGGN